MSDGLGDLADDILNAEPADDGGDDEIPDRDGVYDPVDDLDGRDVPDVEWPRIEPTFRDLTAEEWGIHGEGVPDDVDRFTAMLNGGRLGTIQAELRPEPPEGWAGAGMPMVRSAQKPRGKALFAHIGATPETMLHVEGMVGERQSGIKRKEFALDLEPKVADYAERFRQGDRPGRFFALITHDGVLEGPQEGRHRAAAAMMADVPWVPVVVVMDTEGQFTRRDHRRPDGQEEPYISHPDRYPMRRP